MTQDVYCAMIHGGLHLNLKSEQTPTAGHCCLRKDGFLLDFNSNFWNDKKFLPLRQINSVEKKWDTGCANCENLEKSGMISFRNGMNDGLGIIGQTELSGPARIDLTFDISCNLACRICSPTCSTFWQKHLRDNGRWDAPIFSPRKKNDVIKTLEKLDLSNLRQLIFCGGETLLGQEYWHVAKWLVDNVPDAKNQLIISFQTNGTQPISQKNYDIISKAHMIRLNISIDGIGDKFEYMRWPANWQQVKENILFLKDNCPDNVMFLVEETISIFNLLYLDETETWIKENFSMTPGAAKINHTRHLALGIFSLDNCSSEYVEQMAGSDKKYLIPAAWKENKQSIRKMIKEIKDFDQMRKQRFETTFPEVAELYKRFW